MRAAVLLEIGRDLRRTGDRWCGCCIDFKIVTHMLMYQVDLAARLPEYAITAGDFATLQLFEVAMDPDPEHFNAFKDLVPVRQQVSGQEHFVKNEIGARLRYCRRPSLMCFKRGETELPEI